MTKIKCAIIGSGNIGTDLMIKIMRNVANLEMGAMVGIDPNSDGLARAARLGVPTTHEGIDGPAQAARITPTSKSCSTPPRPTPISSNNAILQKRRQEGDRPDAGGHRPLHHPGDQRRRQYRRAQCQHGHLRRPGDDPDGACGAPGRRPGDLRRDRRLDFVEVGRPRHARQYRRVHRDHVEAPSRCSAAPSTARRSSS